MPDASPTRSPLYVPGNAEEEVLGRISSLTKQIAYQNREIDDLREKIEAHRAERSRLAARRDEWVDFAERLGIPDDPAQL